MTEETDPKEEQIQKVKDALHKVVDEMVETLQTINADSHIQLHIFANDFCPSMNGTQQGIVLHDIFCEMDTFNLTTTSVRHQLGVDTLVRRNNETYNMSTPIGQLMIESQERIDPSSSIILSLESQMDEQIRARKRPPLIQVEKLPNVSRPRLKSTGELIIPINSAVTNSQLAEMVQNAWRFFNRDVAKQVDSLIGKHNAEIIEQAMSDNSERDSEGQEVIPRMSMHGVHQLSSYGTLFLNPDSQVSHEQLTDMLSTAELYDINERHVRDLVFIHNQTIGQAQSNINPIRIENDTIFPSSTQFIGIRIRQSIIESAANIGESIASRAAHLIDAHNRNRLRELRERELDEVDTEIIRQGLNEEEQILQPPPMEDIVLPVPDEPGDVAQDVNRPRATPILPGDPRYTPIPDRDIEVTELTEPVGGMISENQLSDTIIINDEVFGVSLENGIHIVPENIGYIGDEDRDFLIENAWRVGIGATVMRDIIDSHNERHVDQSVPTEIFPAPEDTPVEDYDLGDTGFSDENISRILPHRNGIDVEETDDGEERPDGGRPT